MEETQYSVEMHQSNKRRSDPIHDGFAHEDMADMHRMGKDQEFRRNFKVISISSFCVVTMMGFVFVLINIPRVIQTAGTGGSIVIYIANFFGFLTVVLSLAEMSSIAPTAGGQYHWTSEFAPPSIQKFSSYISGWLSSISWLVGVASGIFLAGNLIPVVISLTHPKFVPAVWQGYLFVVAICTTSFLINGFLAKHLPLLEGFILCFTILAFAAILIVLLVLRPKLTGSEVFQSFTPISQLDSDGALALLSAQVFVFYSFLGSDSTAHMAEETNHAAIVIPRAMVWSYCIVSLLNFVTLIVVGFCWVSPKAFDNSKTGYAFISLLTSATGSAEGATTIASIIITLIILSVTNFMASTSRQVFAFARDDGLPFSTWIARVNKQTLTPINSLVVVLIFVILICLIGLGSVVAFNAIVSLQVLALAGTYEVSLMSLTWRRMFGKRLPPSPWSLGRWGLPINIMAVVYGLYILFYAAIPGFYPVTLQNFNWAPAMFVGCMALSLIYYVVWARTIYAGPVVKVIAE